MSIEVWKQPANDFKIKRKNDVKTFFDCLTFSGCYTVKINKGFIIRIKKDKSGVIKVSEKRGNIFDIFNPELVIPDDEIVSYIYKYRKAINNKFFND